jgi:hypothetical protein
MSYRAGLVLVTVGPAIMIEGAGDDLALIGALVMVLGLLVACWPARR